MARKSTKKKKKTTSKGKTKGKGRKSASRKKTSTKKSTRTRKQTSKKQSKKKTQQKGGERSFEGKLDIIGIALALIGLLTVLSLLSSNHGSVVGGWVSFLRVSFGLGIYILPVCLILGGLWLVLRNFESVPRVSVERVVGSAMIFVNILTWLHFFYFPEDREVVFQLAASGLGGGYIGAALFEAFRMTLGIGGTVILLLGLFLISLAMTLDMSVIELFGWVPPLLRRLGEIWQQYKPSWNLSPEESSSSIKTHLPQVKLGTEAKATPQGSISLEQVEAPTTWVLPSRDNILEEGSQVDYDEEYDHQRARVIEETLDSFGAPASVVEINRGPTITQFGVEPDFIESRGKKTRVRVGKISALADDLALALSARRIRIQAPVPGKGFVGIEVPNDEVSLVALHDLIDSVAFRRIKSSLRFCLGQDVSGNAVAADLTVMPHLLIAGATGSGKSVCVNSLITSLLLNNTPNDLRLVMIDPKRVELGNYNGIPHLLAPVVTKLDRVIGTLQWIAREMNNRYHKLAKAGVRNISDYNARAQAESERKIPYLVVVIDELADLMMLAPNETEGTITRLAQLARATGIHLVIATQRPSVDVVTGLIKANFPARVAFAVASGVDSRVILDQTGAERLLGRGDLLFQAPDAAEPVRLQGTFVSDNEINRLVRYWRSFAGVSTAPTSTGGVVDAPPTSLPLKQMPLWEEMEKEEDTDPLLTEAIDLVRRQGRASISMLQRRLRIGYTRGARLVDTMQDKGIIGAPDSGTGVREVLDYGSAGPPAEERGD